MPYEKIVLAFWFTVKWGYYIFKLTYENNQIKFTWTKKEGNKVFNVLQKKKLKKNNRILFHFSKCNQIAYWKLFWSCRWGIDIYQISLSLAQFQMGVGETSVTSILTGSPLYADIIINVFVDCYLKSNTDIWRLYIWELSQ